MPPKKPLNIVGERVRIARQRRTPPLTQDELSGQLAAYEVLLDRAAVSKVEGGTRYVSDFEIRALCKVLGVSPGWLLGMEK
jgi:transcriptional regulator with XRE-family HTH domain